MITITNDMQVLLSSHQLQLILRRLAHQVLEDEEDLSGLAIIGLQPRGIYISDALMVEIGKLTNQSVDYGKLDITFYRDDFRTELHSANDTDIPFSIEGKKVILVDDVLYTGRTIRAAMDALLDFGRPRAVKLCTLVNRRFNREFPIQPDFCGLAIDSNISQKVKVMQDSGEVVLYS